jgi:hypothetical protein
MRELERTDPVRYANLNSNGVADANQAPASTIA